MKKHKVRFFKPRLNAKPTMRIESKKQKLLKKIHSDEIKREKYKE